MKLKTLSLALICTGAFVALTAFAQDTTTGTSGGSTPGGSSMGTSGQAGSTTPSGQPTLELRASKAIGADVKTAQGERLGRINDLILNPSNGRVDFAVIDWNNKLVPVPFNLLNASLTQGRGGFLAPTGPELSFTANVDTQKLQTAPTIDKSRWMDIQQPGFRQKVYSHYGVQPPEGMGAPGSGQQGQGTQSSQGGGVGTSGTDMQQGTGAPGGGSSQQGTGTGSDTTR